MINGTQNIQFKKGIYAPFKIMHIVFKITTGTAKLILLQQYKKKS